MCHTDARDGLYDRRFDAWRRFGSGARKTQWRSLSARSKSEREDRAGDGAG